MAKVAKTDSFIFYGEWIDHLCALEPDEAIEVLKAVRQFANDEIPIKLQGAGAMAFSFISAQVKRDKIRYDETCAKRAEAGRKGAEVTNGKRRQKTAKDGKYRQTSANSADNEYEYENEYDTEYVLKKESKKKKAAAFVPPTLEEVKEYCLNRGNGVDAQRFIDFYTARGWMLGKNKMKDWRAAVRTWEKSEPKKIEPKKELTIDDFWN